MSEKQRQDDRAAWAFLFIVGFLGVLSLAYPVLAVVLAFAMAVAMPVWAAALNIRDAKRTSELIVPEEVSR